MAEQETRTLHGTAAAYGDVVAAFRRPCGRRQVVQRRPADGSDVQVTGP